MRHSIALQGKDIEDSALVQLVEFAHSELP